MKDYHSINFIRKVAKISTEYEKNNTALKKRYIISNINLYHKVVGQISGYSGSFGTGHPFYGMSRNLGGDLPVIEEQIRYNKELEDEVLKSKHSIWKCSICLQKNESLMPDLKQICVPCTMIDSELKPRKVINRLPDIDMWMVCDDEYVEEAKQESIQIFDDHSLYTSDVDPIQTIQDMIEINSHLKKGTMPEKKLPLDAHIIGYSRLLDLIRQMPEVLSDASIDGAVPYLPIHPDSLRKVWQKDDVAYNFVHDYLSSFTEHNFSGELREELNKTRQIIASEHSLDDLYRYLFQTGPDSVKKRHKTKQLKKCFEERIHSWKK